MSARPTGLADTLERWLLAWVIAAGVAGLVLTGPARYVAAHHGIPVALGVLVFTTGAALDPTAWRATRPVLPRAGLAVLAGAVALPALAWVAAELVGDPALRRGVLVTGVAPAEVASVALVGLAGGQAAVTALVLVASVLIAVLAAGPVLALLGAPAMVSAATLVVGLAVIVAAPLAAGTTTRAVLGTRARTDAAIRIAGTAALLVLLWQVAGQVQLTAAYARAGLALTGFLTGSAALGWLLALRLPRPHRLGVSLPIGMRDFAIAAGIANAAYGPRAAAPLAAYGVLVLLYGAVTAHRATHHSPASDPLTILHHLLSY